MKKTFNRSFFISEKFSEILIPPPPFRNLYAAPEKNLESAYQFKIQQVLNYFHSEYSFIISSTRLLMASLTFCDSPLYSGFKPK